MICDCSDVPTQLEQCIGHGPLDQWVMRDVLADLECCADVGCCGGQCRNNGDWVYICSLNSGIVWASSAVVRL